MAPQRIFKNAIVGALLVGAVVYLSLLTLLYAGQRDILYHPTQTVPQPAAYGLPEMTSHRVPAEGGVRPLVWWAPPRNNDHPVILYFHGNAGHLGSRAGRARSFLNDGYGVLLAGYRYNAGAGGTASEDGLLADARAAVEFVRTIGYQSEQLVFYGESLGSGVATAMAAEYGGAALVLESAYSSIADVAQDIYWYFPVRWLVKDEFDSATRIQSVEAPVLLIHGENDGVTPAWSARKLFRVAPEPKEAHFLEGGDHANLYRLGAKGIVADFLQRHVLTGRTVADQS